jgi:hypothetical protein
VSWLVGLSPDDLDVLISVATSVGHDVHNPEGGLNFDATDEMVLETVTDIAQGYPHHLTVNRNDLSMAEERLVVSAFLRGVVG